MLPLFAFDQLVNAERVDAVGAGLHLQGGTASSAAMAPALARVLTEPSYREHARAIADQITEPPDVKTAVPILEELAART
jgi:glycosyltransferase